jgi:hypothetical protein
LRAAPPDDLKYLCCFKREKGRFPSLVALLISMFGCLRTCMLSMLRASHQLIVAMIQTTLGTMEALGLSECIHLYRCLLAHANLPLDLYKTQGSHTICRQTLAE